MSEVDELLAILNRITSGQDRLIHFWDVATGRLEDTLQGHTDSVSCLVFSSDGRWLFSGGWDKMVCQWGIPSPTRRYNG